MPMILASKHRSLAGGTGELKELGRHAMENIDIPFCAVGLAVVGRGLKLFECRQGEIEGR